MAKRFYFFRPGEEARMLARCQFGVDESGQCGAMFTYPIPGYPWRRNIVKNFEFVLSDDEKSLLFSEVKRLREHHPNECLSNEDLWSDRSEKANGVTRDRATDTLCVTIAIYGSGGEKFEYFSMREDSQVLLESPLFMLITRLLEPHERYDRTRRPA